MSLAVHRVTAFVLLSAGAFAGPATDYSLARSAHFEVYSQGSAVDARATLLEFERLRAFFAERTGLVQGNRQPVRVITFRSSDEYQRYQLRPAADAYYVGTETRDYIVMTHDGGGDLQTAAHEYAHFLLHANSFDLPPWLNEGLPEFFSTVRQREGIRKTHGEPPPRARVLRNRKWMPLSELLEMPADSPLREQRETAGLFYAESWALTDLLLRAPDYQARFSEFLAALSSQTTGVEAITAVYGKTLEETTRDLHRWVEKRRVSPIYIPAPWPGELAVEASGLTAFDWRSVLADLLLSTRQLQRARAAYEELAAEAPENADISAALATIAAEQGDWTGARRHWRAALDHGIANAAACYRYGMLASDAGFVPEDVQAALERAITLQPGFDDAHYALAHLESNRGRYESAVGHLQAVKQVSAARQFSYWSSLSYALSELGRRQEAKDAATRAGQHAATAEERARAAQLAEIAETDMAVRFTRDADGNSRLVAVRVPHDASDWNPFIEPGDQIRRVEGKLLAIECDDPTKVSVETAAGSLIVAIPKRDRVQMRNAPAEFTCGPQPLTSVIVVYAASQNSTGDTAGVVRGLEFR